jgi:hypothetical protein
MMLSVAPPNVDTSDKILSTSSTIIWSRKIKVLFCMGLLYYASGKEFNKFCVLQLINNIARMKAKGMKWTTKKPNIPGAMQIFRNGAVIYTEFVVARSAGR